MSSRIFPQFSLTGRTAIVSGAGSGLGLAIAEALAEAGANVAILYHKNIAAVDAAKHVAKEYDVKCKPLLEFVVLRLKPGALTQKCNITRYRISSRCYPATRSRIHCQSSGD